MWYNFAVPRFAVPNLHLPNPPPPVSEFFGLSKNLSSPAYGDSVVTAVASAGGGNTRCAPMDSRARADMRREADVLTPRLEHCLGTWGQGRQQQPSRPFLFGTVLHPPRKPSLRARSSPPDDGCEQKETRMPMNRNSAPGSPPGLAWVCKRRGWAYKCCTAAHTRRTGLQSPGLEIASDVRVQRVCARSLRLRERKSDLPWGQQTGTCGGSESGTKNHNGKRDALNNGSRSLRTGTVPLMRHRVGDPFCGRVQRGWCSRTQTKAPLVHHTAQPVTGDQGGG